MRNAVTNVTNMSYEEKVKLGKLFVNNMRRRLRLENHNKDVLNAALTYSVWRLFWGNTVEVVSEVMKKKIYCSDMEVLRARKDTKFLSLCSDIAKLKIQMDQ